MKTLAVFLLVLAGGATAFWYIFLNPTGLTHSELNQSVPDAGLSADDRALVRAKQIAAEEKARSEEETNAAATGQ